jgi:hypothetical protein
MKYARFAADAKVEICMQEETKLTNGYLFENFPWES